MDTITIGRNTIRYDIVRTPRKTIGIKVDQDKRIEVRAPQYFSDAEIREVVHKKADWILEKLDLMAEIKPKPDMKEFVSGEKLPYLGRRYRLKVRDVDGADVQVRLYQGKFCIDVGCEIPEAERREHIREELTAWYRERARVKIKERVDAYKKVVGREPSGIRIKGQKTLWASCSSKGNLNFNYKIIMAPLSIVDYVVVHELIHLQHPNHAREFWRMLEAVIPDYEERKEWLRVNGRRLTLE